jgi:hypothetical protein
MYCSSLILGIIDVNIVFRNSGLVYYILTVAWEDLRKPQEISGYLVSGLRFNFKPSWT